jgi:hypothetical protein
MFQKRILKEEVTEGWITLDNEELHDLCFSPDIISVIKLRRMGCSGHVARVWNGINTDFW